MRIAINASILDEKMDGVRVFTLNVINSLINLPESKKHDITIFTPITKYFKETKNLRVVKIPSLMINSRYEKIAPFFRFFWNNLVYTFLAKDFDVSYSTTPNGSLFLKNQIITIHDIVVFHYPEIYKIRSFYFKFILPIMLKKLKKVITVSNFLKEDIAKLFDYSPDKIKVCSEGYNKDFFKLNKKTKNKNYILFVGASYEYKNLKRALAAYSVLPSNLKEKYRIIIVGGRENYLNRLKILIEELGISKKVWIIKYLEQKELAKLYNESYLFIYPSLHESFGLPPIEAMASGCPVAASDIPAIKEICGDAVYYFNPLNEQDIKKSMEKLLTDKSLRKKFIKRGLKRCKLFSWEESARKILNALEHSK